MKAFNFYNISMKHHFEIFCNEIKIQLIENIFIVPYQNLILRIRYRKSNRKLTTIFNSIMDRLHMLLKTAFLSCLIITNFAIMFNSIMDRLHMLLKAALLVALQLQNSQLCLTMFVEDCLSEFPYSHKIHSTVYVHHGQTSIVV